MVQKNQGAKEFHLLQSCAHSLLVGYHTVCIKSWFSPPPLTTTKLAQNRGISSTWRTSNVRQGDFGIQRGLHFLKSLYQLDHRKWLHFMDQFLLVLFSFISYSGMSKLFHSEQKNKPLPHLPGASTNRGKRQRINKMVDFKDATCLLSWQQIGACCYC